MNTRPLLAVLILLSLHTATHAQLFKCKGANGQSSFQDSPCTGNAPAPERKQPIPGEKNEGFGPQKKYDHGTAGNWDAARPVTVPRAPQPPMPPTQASVPTPPPAASSVDLWKGKEREAQKRQADEQAKANAEAQAFNQMQACNQARQQLGVAKEPRRIYSYDNNGDRKYVEDENRAALVASAQQRVAESCR